MEQLQFINRVKETVHHVFPNAKTYLFGSRARTDYTSSSDWDILVLMPNILVTIDEKRKIWHPLYELEIETGELISCKIFNEKEWFTTYSETPLFLNFQKDAIKI